jgi:transcriptional repressor NrdR
MVVRCPTCGADDDRVVDSRPADDAVTIRRRRECRACGQRFTTFERIELPGLVVRKIDGRLQPFDRNKVRDGMDRAAKGRIETDVLERAAAAIEAELRVLGTEVTAEQVGLKVLAHLRELDEVSYVRFASVYKDFQAPEDFEKELSSLRKAAKAGR